MLTAAEQSLLVSVVVESVFFFYSYKLLVDVGQRFYLILITLKTKQTE